MQEVSVGKKGSLAGRAKERVRDCEESGERQVATVEEDKLFGQKIGYPTTRRPIDYRRELTTDSWEIVSEWFKAFKVTIGPKANEAISSENPETAQMTARLFYTWRDLFVEDMVQMPATDLVTHTIPTREDAIPRRARDKLYTPREREWMDRNIPRMLEAGIIDYSVSPWCHRTKFVPKKDGDLRMVHVYVPINMATVANSYPMRRMELVLNSLMQPGLTVYFQADAANGYWAVPLAQEHAYKTAFGTHRGQYHYLRMGQGLSGAPQTYTRLKDTMAGPVPEPNPEPALEVLAGKEGSFQYFMDDDFGAFKSFFDQWRFLHLAYFPRLAWGRFTLRPKKTGFFLDQIRPLGLVLQGVKGLRPSEDKVAAIRDYPTPNNLDEVNKFLWMTTYLRHFIPGRTDHALVLKEAAELETKEEWHARDVGKKDKNGRIQRGPRRVMSWKWTERQDRSFEALKKAVLERAVFGGSELRQYHLATDASRTGIGGVLFQLLDCDPGTRITTANRKSMKIVMFISLRLEGAETRYSTTEQETLAVLRCLQEVSWLVQGSAYPVLVYTDHSALIYLLRHDDAHGKIARWQQKLSQFDVEYVHIPGSQNVIADGLSRMPARFFDTELEEQTDKIEKGQGMGTERGGLVNREVDNGERAVGEHGGKVEREGQGSGERGGISLGENRDQPASQEEDLGNQGEEVVEAFAVREGGQGTGIEVWEIWKRSDWYGELMRFLLRGDFGGRDLGKNERRRIRLWAKKFVIFDGEKRKGLFYKEKNGKLALCILEEDVETTLEQYHDCHGHFAGRLLAEYLLGKAYWPTRIKDCHYYARTCPDCQSMGPIRPSVGIKPVVYLQPFDMVGLDFIGPITPTSARGNRYIIIMVDYFSRFLFARAIPAATGEAARGLFESATATFGNPLAVYTDNGQHFLGDEFHGTLVRRDIKHFPAPKTHPSSVGLAERYVQLVMGILKRRIQGSSKELWDTLLPSAVQTLNTRGVKVHGYTPSELLLGYNPRAGPNDDITAHILNDAIDQNAYDIHLARTEERRELGQERMVAAAEWQEEKEGEIRRKGEELQEGDLVLLRRFDVARHHGMKLESQWEGPYKLVDLAYHRNSGRLQDLTTHEIVRTRKGGLKERVHVNDLKLFLRRDPGQIPAPIEVLEADSVELRRLGETFGWRPGKRSFQL